MYKKEVMPKSNEGDYCRYINTLLFTGMLNNRFRELTLKANPPFVVAGSYYGKSYARTKDVFELYAGTSDTGMARASQALLTENRRVLHGFTLTECDLHKEAITVLIRT